MAKKEVTDVRKEIEKYGNSKPYMNYYRANPKYKALLPKEAEVFFNKIFFLFFDFWVYF